jgi:hypothetical protein
LMKDKKLSKICAYYLSRLDDAAIPYMVRFFEEIFILIVSYRDSHNSYIGSQIDEIKHAQYELYDLLIAKGNPCLKYLNGYKNNEIISNIINEINKNK